MADYKSLSFFFLIENGGGREELERVWFVNEKERKECCAAVGRWWSCCCDHFYISLFTFYSISERKGDADGWILDRFVYYGKWGIVVGKAKV